MNREIKFRAWDSESERMIHSEKPDDDVLFLIDEKGIHCGVIGEETDDTGLTYSVSSDMDCNIMQFTGLKDKNGKKIYEGDIISNNEFPHLLIVGFNIGCSSFCASKTNNFSTEKCYWFENDICVIQDEWKVIGNIYENPELLND